MSDAKILVTKPGAISLIDRDNLLLVGIVVVETENPDDVHFLSLETMPISTNAILTAVCEGVLAANSHLTVEAIGRNICKAVIAASEKGPDHD